MDLEIKGRRALVTASGRGLGRNSALCLAREGVRVAVVSRTRSDVESLVKEMGGEQAGHYGAVLDLTGEGAPKRYVDMLHKNFGSPDIVVHNLGGTLNVSDPFCSVEDWRKVWRFNLEVAIELNLYLIPPMREHKWGRVVFISSIASVENHGPVTYCSIKAALTAYARSIGRILAPEGVVVSAVLPGAVLTEGGHWDISSRERPEHVKKYLEDRMAIRRFGTPDEIGNAVAFLCSEKASFFTGSIVPIDGGQGRGFFGQ